MQEKEYCISKFNKNFGAIKGKRIAIYGSGDYARSIVENFPEYCFVCVVDDLLAGRYFSGYYIVSLSQMQTLNIEYLIIATQMQQSYSIYEKINLNCKKNQFTIYNLYGIEIALTQTLVLEKKMIYPGITNDTLKQMIDVSDVVSFDIDDTLFAIKMQESIRFYQEVEVKLWELGVRINNFAYKVLQLKEQMPYGTLEEIVTCVVETEGGDVDTLSKILYVFFQKIKEVFLPRNAVVDALRYAVKCGKKVYIIEDVKEYRLSKHMWTALLEECDISGYEDIICSTEHHVGKYDGLYRVMLERIGFASCLHIGDEEQEDIILPYLYGICSFLVMSPYCLLQILDPIVPELMINVNTCDFFEEYISMTYRNEYCISAAEAERIKNRRYAIQLIEKMKFYALYSNAVSDVKLTHKPVIYDYLCEFDTVATCPKLTFENLVDPEVSIIIPAYNQFGFTYNCLKAILENTTEISYEVIVADDHSTDEIKNIERIVIGIKVLHNEKNLGFLLNCNNAAQYARGKYILFLNNDTQVQYNWLKPLVELMKLNKDVGMVGSKLVYPEGYLQEAGGILWKDGSAWNYGHLNNPENPEFAYVKEVDYISGAAIMIRKSLWKKIGGFDETFIPAYYEDTDLAFEVRKNGYKVLYQPASVVIHFEGVSNGNNVLSGQKRYQTINQKKFFLKWKDILGREHFENGTELYLAKDRGQTKKQILVVDHYVPNYDKDAGGRCTFMYIKMFLKLGLKVTFIGDSFAKIEPYTGVLNQLGVEVLFGDYYRENWREWLKDNLKYFDYIYLQRPHISIKYIDLVKEYSWGKIFYFAHDLHYLRMYRDYLVSGNEESLKESEYWKKIEMELFEKTDVGHVVGSYEQEVIQKKFPDKPIRNIPLYIYEDFPPTVEKDFSKRRDILFVGSFNHLPNVDAVIWFATEVFPNLLEKYPDLKWHIVGSNAPERVKLLESDHIILEGFVSDTKLCELYNNCRLVVVPLRYGAGVKGKVVEAAYYQIPVVTTTIGGEGIDASVGAFAMEDRADKMAELIEHLYIDLNKLEKMSNAGVELIREYFTLEKAEKVLLADMNLERLAI